MTGHEILEKCADNKLPLTGEDRKTLKDKDTILEMYEGKRLTPVQAMRAYCLDCNGSDKEVALCPCFDCPLYSYRFGTNPFLTRVYTEEEREVARVRMKASVESGSLARRINKAS